MSKPPNTRKPPTGPDGATPTQPMTLTGIIRTGKGYALATAFLDKDGALVSVTIGGSQVAPFGKQFIAEQNRRAASLLAAKL